MKIKAVADLIGTLYDASTDPSKWQSALEQMCRLVNAKAANIMAFEPANNNHIRFSLDYATNPDWVEKLHTTYANLCPIGPIVLLAEIDKPDSIFFYIDEEEYRETRFYREWCAPQGYLDMIGAVLTRRVDEIGCFALYSGPAKPRFDADDLELVGVLAPHVRRAVTVADLFEHRAVPAAGFDGLIDQLATAMFLVDGQMKLLRANAAGEALLASGRIATLRHGLLQLNDEQSQVRLRDAVSQARKDPQLVPVVARGSQLTAAVVPARANHGTCAVILHEPKPNSPAFGRHLVETFRFTPREIAVLLPLLEGRTVAEIAAQLGVGEETIRTHVKRLLEKSGSERQADLIQKVLKVMPPIRI